MTQDEYVLFWSRKLSERATRLHRLTVLKAPPYILASARRLVFNALMRIPVEVSMLMLEDSSDDELRREEQEFLSKHGFYDDKEKGTTE